MFLTYNEYKSMGGGLDETAFNIYGYEAERKIDAATHGRIKNPTERVKRCIVRVADLLMREDIMDERVTSWSNDGVSESIKDISAEEYQKKVEVVIHDYLINEVDDNGTPLLYLGVDGND